MIRDARLLGVAAVCALAGTAACGLVLGLEDHEAYPAEGGVVEASTPLDGTTDASDASDASNAADTTSEPVPEAGLTCDGSSLCGDACVDLQTDESNCGKCGVACSTSSCYRATCNGGSVTQLTAGAEHACALLHAGDVWCWGADDQAQILGPTGAATCPLGPCRPQPVPIPGLPNAVQISAGGDQTCAVDADGGVWCWGSNASAGLGHAPGGDPTCTTPDASVPCNAQPARVAGLPGPATSVASGQAGFACALVSNGVYCWGDDTFAELGPAGTIGTSTPTPQFVTAGASGIAAGFAHACAVAGGAVSCWGTNAAGELGHTAGSGDQTCAGGTPCDPSVQALGIGGVTLAHAGFRASCFETVSGVECLGANDVGQLGLGSDVPASTPNIALETVEPNVLSFDFGSRTACAITSGGLFCWGSDETHQTAAATDESCTAGAPCLLFGSSVPLTNVVEVRASTYSTFARTSDGGVWAWGNNGAGQLGHVPGDGGDLGGCDPTAFPSGGTVCDSVPSPVQGLP